VDEPTKRNSGARRSGRKPATTPESRENQLVSAAVDLAEKQLLAGTASAQVITHYLKLGSTRERLEQQRLAHEVELLAAKRQQIEDQAKVETMYKEALDAMRSYSGLERPEDFDADD